MTAGAASRSHAQNVRILATTGGYVDDGTGAPTDFISIIAFAPNQNFFLPVVNARGINMPFIVSHFEAYAALKQRLPGGVFARTPCGTMGTGAKPCFPVTSVATPVLRQDWRFASNRNAIDGSDGNDPLNQSGNGASNSPFGYFCDDLLGMWIITYFWFTVDPAHGPGMRADSANLAAKNGLSLDGTPIIKTADELNNQLRQRVRRRRPGGWGGADGGAVWLVCPAIPDPRNGAIARDAFLDTVRTPNFRRSIRHSPATSSACSRPENFHNPMAPVLLVGAMNARLAAPIWPRRRCVGRLPNARISKMRKIAEWKKLSRQMLSD